MKIIVPLQPRSCAELEMLLPKLKSQVDLVEIWLDVLVQELMFAPTLVPLVQRLLESARAQFGVEYLGVCKMPSEKGRFPGNKNERLQVLQHFLQLGGEYVDLDVLQNTPDDIAAIPPEKLWLSAHDFKTVPSDLESLKAKMETFKPALTKFAVTPENETQLNTFIEFAKSTSSPSIFTTMGDLGAEGREKLKPFTYGAFYALDEKRRTATGQPILDDL
jgi:3-dehydroquinate dehydratase type I